MQHVSEPSPKATFVGMGKPHRIARSLRAARQLAGLTQVQVAAESGVSREVVSLLENGRRGVRVETLDAVLDVLGYEIAFVPRNQREQQMRDRARSYRARRHSK